MYVAIKAIILCLMYLFYQLYKQQFTVLRNEIAGSNVDFLSSNHKLCYWVVRKELNHWRLQNGLSPIYKRDWNLLKDGSDLQRVNNVWRVIWSLLSYVKTCSYLRARFDNWSMRTLRIVKCVFILFGDLFCLQTFYYWTEIEERQDQLGGSDVAGKNAGFHI